MNINKKYFQVVIILLLTSYSAQAYPIDGYLVTGIKRLYRLHKIITGEIKDKAPISGAMMSTDSISLSLVGGDIQAMPTIDTELQKQLNSLFPNLDESYSIAVMDITYPDHIRYAERQSNRGFQPGSVGKLAVVTGLFCELENLYPDDFNKRTDLLKNKVVRAGYWAIPNIHTVPIFDTLTNKLEKRFLIESDKFSLYEWVDHMLSVSSNGAASVVWREVMLMREFGEKYIDLTEEEAENFFQKTNKKDLSDMAIHVISEPLRELGISEDEFRVGTFFTRGASNKITPQGGSIGSPKGLIKWLWNLEHGQIIDRKSSLEIKKMMYMTDRRIRYAANKSLDDSAVYFKSGSLYSCKEEPGYICEKYKGNQKNFMNSVAIVESPNGIKYMVVLMTNVLKKNSNSDHNALAGKIHQIIVNGSRT